MNNAHARPWLLLALLLATCSLLLAAPPPELIILKQVYDQAVTERVEAPFQTALSALNAKFTTALDKAATDAKAAGKLPEVLAIATDRQAIQSATAAISPLPETDEDSTPESLKKLRAIYRDQFDKLLAQRTANQSALVPGYVEKLKTLEVTLTKADRVDEAKEVLGYREGIEAGVAAASPLAGTTPATSTTIMIPTDGGPKGHSQKRFSRDMACARKSF